MRSMRLMLPAISAGLALSAIADAQTSTYLALGDSLAWGYTNAQDALDQAIAGGSAGDRGYVALYRDFLASQNGGTEPGLINLAVPLESTFSFFNAPLPTVATNANYGVSIFDVLATDPPAAPAGTPTQSQLLVNAINDEIANGNDIGWVTIHLGANDLLGLASDPAFFMLDPLSQQQAINATIDGIETGVRSVLDTVTTLAGPAVEISLLGLYDPFAILPSDPRSALGSVITPLINALYEDLANQYGASFVDLDAVFTGREAELTQILTLDGLPGLIPESPNIHPTALGYEVIAQQLIPSPASVAPLAGLVLVATRRRRAG
ncbi:MAG: SGNH/GDSL hydrolase family protein [Planctomycetota bacterium]